MSPTLVSCSTVAYWYETFDLEFRTFFYFKILSSQAVSASGTSRDLQFERTRTLTLHSDIALQVG